jgi:hypothetical protein
VIGIPRDQYPIDAIQVFVWLYLFLEYFPNEVVVLEVEAGGWTR